MKEKNQKLPINSEEDYYNLIIDDFYDSDGNFIKRLIYDSDEKNSVIDIIKTLRKNVEEYDQKRKKNIKVNSELTINQLRKFYDSFLKIYYSKQDEEIKKIWLLMLKANAEYSTERNHNKYFRIFLDNRISLVINKTGKYFNKYLNAFKLHFEAIIGYYQSEKIKGEKNEND